jgi:hypothetical protein
MMVVVLNMMKLDSLYRSLSYSFICCSQFVNTTITTTITTITTIATTITTIITITIIITINITNIIITNTNNRMR